MAGKVSTQQPIICGIPQGSVLGPKVYCMYSRPIGDIIKKHSLSHHSYAGDTQIYMTFKPTDINFKIAADNIQNCISEESHGWNKIFLN